MTSSDAESVNCHLLLVAAVSPVLANACKDDQIDAIIFPDFSSEELASFMNLLYCGRLVHLVIHQIINHLTRSSDGNYFLTKSTRELLYELRVPFDIDIDTFGVFEPVHAGGDTCQLPNTTCNDVSISCLH